MKKYAFYSSTSIFRTPEKSAEGVDILYKAVFSVKEHTCTKCKEPYFGGKRNCEAAIGTKRE